MKSAVSKSKHVILRRKEIKSGFSLYLDINFGGQQWYEFLKIYISKRGNTPEDKFSLQLAERIKAKRIIHLQSAYLNEPDLVNQNINFIVYFEQLTIKKKRKAWNNTLSHLKKFSNKMPLLKNINPKWLDNFKNYLLERMAVNSVATYFECINAAFNQAVRDDLILFNPCMKIDRPKKKSVIKIYLTVDELKLLDTTECKNPETKRAFLFSCFTGLRNGDIRRLKYKNIENGNIVFRQGKTKAVEYIPLSNQAKKYLNNSQNPNELIFKLISDKRTSYHLRDWMQEAGINKHVTFHSARHTFATLALTYGVDLYTVSKLLGHADIKTTQVYAKIIDEKKKKAVEQLPEF